MTIQFDTLTFAKRLTAAGEKVEVAEAHAMALKELVMDTIATKGDVADLRKETALVRGDLLKEIAQLRKDLGEEITQVRKDLGGEIAELRTDLGKARTEIGDLRTELKFDIAASEERVRDDLRREIGDLRKDMDTLGLKMTVRLGGMMVVGIGALAGLNRLL